MNNDQEWRSHILKKLDKLEDNQSELLVIATTLKVKISLFASGFGAVAGLAASFIMKKLGLE
jgi:hypothetical protein